MEVIKTSLEGLILLKPAIFSDTRGYFFESYQKERFHQAGIDADFVQDNESMSAKDVLRGLHFQKPPFEQAKLVRVVHGSVLDVAVDIRKKSPTYGKYEAVILSAENKLMLWIPEGFAHGYLSLEDNTIFQYKCSQYYNKESECSIIWNDLDLNVQWGIDAPLVSDKDLQGLRFRELVSPF